MNSPEMNPRSSKSRQQPPLRPLRNSVSPGETRTMLVKEMNYQRQVVSRWETALSMAHNRLDDLLTEPRHRHEFADLLAEAAADVANAKFELRAARERHDRLRHSLSKFPA